MPLIKGTVSFPEGKSQIQMEESFTWCLIILMALMWLYIVTIYFCTMRIRLRVFNKEYMSQFADEHRAAFPEKPDPPQYGYPDTGYGWYGRKLDYYQWV